MPIEQLCHHHAFNHVLLYTYDFHTIFADLVTASLGASTYLHF
jgi:hypothetical protein